MNRCWIHTLIYRGDCDLCVTWSGLQMVLYGQTFFRSTSLGLMPLEGSEVATIRSDERIAILVRP